ncbi:hypothetical protein Hanom_Chr07g00667831 [Helianthus anomalus]
MIKSKLLCKTQIVEQHKVINNYVLLFFDDLEELPSLLLFLSLLSPLVFPCFSGFVLLDLTLITPPEGTFPPPFCKALSKSTSLSAIAYLWRNSGFNKPSLLALKSS